MCPWLSRLNPATCSMGKSRAIPSPSVSEVKVMRMTAVMTCQRAICVRLEMNCRAAARARLGGTGMEQTIAEAGYVSLPRTEGAPYLALFWRDVGINGCWRESAGSARGLTVREESIPTSRQRMARYGAPSFAVVRLNLRALVAPGARCRWGRSPWLRAARRRNRLAGGRWWRASIGAGDRASLGLLRAALDC